MFAGQIIAPIGHALRFQPSIMIECLMSVQLALGFINAGPACGFQIGDKIFAAILKPCRALGIGAAISTNIDFTARKPGRPTAS